MARSRSWLETARHPRFKRPYTELAYQPMLEVLRYFRANGFKTYIVTGSGQDFVRVFAEKSTEFLPSRSSAARARPSTFTARTASPCSSKSRSSLLNDNNAGKPEAIHLVIGRRPVAAFGNSSGDRQMLEYTGAGGGARLMMLVLHDDADSRVRVRTGRRLAQ